MTIDDKDQAGITAFCVRYLARALRRPEEKIDPRVKFSRLGVDSAIAVDLVVELEEWLGHELAPELAFEYSSVDELARHLAGGPDSKQT